MPWLLVLIFLAILAAHELLAWFWVPRAREERPADEEPIGNLEKRFAKWERWAALPVVLFAIGLMVGWFFFFWAIRNWYHSFIPPSEILLVPSVAMFCVPAFFLGLITCIYPTAILWRLLLGSDYAEYTRYTTERTVVSPAEIFLRFARVIVALAVGFALLTCDWYTRLTPTEFSENSLITLGEWTYPMADVVELRRVAGFLAPTGKQVDRPYYEIAFRDGFRWNTAQDLYQLPGGAYGQLMKRISELTGKKILQYPLPP